MPMAPSNELPDDVVELIVFGFRTLQERARLSLISKQFRRMVARAGCLDWTLHSNDPHGLHLVDYMKVGEVKCRNLSLHLTSMRLLWRNCNSGLTVGEWERAVPSNATLLFDSLAKILKDQQNLRHFTLDVDNLVPKTVPVPLLESCRGLEFVKISCDVLIQVQYFISGVGVYKWLTDLQLHCIDCPESLLKDMGSRFPNLEPLTLRRILLESESSLCSRSLIFLELQLWECEPEDYRLLTLDCPSLETLLLDTSFGFESPQIDVASPMKFLKRVEELTPLDLANFDGKAPNLEFMRIRCRFEEVEDSYHLGPLAQRFTNLRKLELNILPPSHLNIIKLTLTGIEKMVWREDIQRSHESPVGAASRIVGCQDGHNNTPSNNLWITCVAGEEGVLSRNMVQLAPHASAFKSVTLRITSNRPSVLQEETVDVMFLDSDIVVVSVASERLDSHG